MLASSIDRRAKPYDLLRTLRRTPVNGVFPDADPEIVPIMAVITPIGAEQTFEPKGDYNIDGLRVITRTRLYVSDETYEGDNITVNDVTYYVLKASPWDVQGALFWDALIYSVRT